MLFNAEVRCCCEPSKLLGWLEMDDSHLQHSYFCIPLWPTGRLDLRIRGILGHGSYYRAIEAHETDLPTLRMVQGFKEL